MNKKLTEIVFVILGALLGLYAFRDRQKGNKEIEFRKPKVIDGEIV